MKKIIVLACSALVVAAMCSCSSAAKTAKATTPQGMTEVNLPMSGPQYRTDATAYRAVQSGVNPEMSMAKKIAIQNARQELVATLQADISSVIENYAISRRLPSDEKPAYEEKVTELTYTVIQQRVSGLTLADERLFKEENGAYRCFVCLELNKADLESAILDELKKNEKLVQDFEIDEFKKIYEQKMADFQARK